MPRNNPDWESNYTNPKMIAYPSIDTLLKNRYRLIKVLKKGGMSTIYQAEDMQMKHINDTPVYVAIKIIAPYLSNDEYAIRMFQEEALLNMEVLGKQQNIIDIYGYEYDDGYHFLIMQWLEGADLDDELKQLKAIGRRGVRLTDLIRYLKDIAEALSFAHEHGVVHRDIKLSNLFKSNDEHIILLDFGISKIVDESNMSIDSQLLSGCYEYMVPEADMADHKVTPQDDIYSLAICIYQLLSGEVPFKGKMACHRDQIHEERLLKPCKELTHAQWAVLKNAFTINREDRRAKTVKEFMHLFINPSIASDKDVIYANISKEKSLLPIIKILFLIVLLTGATYSFYIWQNKDKQYIENEIVTRVIPIPAIQENNTTKNLASLAQTQTVLKSQELEKDALKKIKPKRMLRATETAQSFTESSIEMEFLLVKSGEFMMGSPDGTHQIRQEQNRDEDEIQHKVMLTQDFYLGKYEVTQNQWNIVMGKNPSHFSQCGMDCPVENVSWEDIQIFILRLNEVMEGSGKNYQYRLPTEAEWEYAVRAGSKEATYNGNLTILGINNIPELDKIAWYAGNSEVNYAEAYDCSEWSGMQYEKINLCGTQSIGKKTPNNWGFYDMLGNVWEWVDDNYKVYPKSVTTDPNIQDASSYRVYRGGSWGYNASFCRAAKRNRRPPSYKHYNLGFRLARDLL